MAIWELMNWLRGGQNLEALAIRIADAAEAAVWQAVHGKLNSMNRAEARGYVFARSGAAVKQQSQRCLAGHPQISPRTLDELVVRARWRVVDRTLQRSVYEQAARETTQRRAA